MHLSPRWLRLLSSLRRWFCRLFIVTPIVGVSNCCLFCYTLRYVHSSIAIILMGKRELVALLSLSSWCLVIVVWLSLAVPWVCLQFGMVLSPDHTHLLFSTKLAKWATVAHLVANIVFEIPYLWCSKAGHSEHETVTRNYLKKT